MNTDLMFSSASDKWATPQKFFNELNEEFHFTLDPCADVTNHKCDKYFTEEQDGLSQDWGNETVFINPPYGRDVTGKWVAKAVQQHKRHGNTIVMLLPARTDTRWFHDYIYNHGVEIRFIKGRLKFGDGKNSAPFPSMVCIWRKKRIVREELDDFLDEFDGV